MAEWLVEEGVGETRALKFENERAVAAMIDWPGRLAPGEVQDALLVSRTAGSKRGCARFGNGEEALVDKLPTDASEGAPIRLEVVRSAIGERGRKKLAQARPTDKEVRNAPTLAEGLLSNGQEVHAVRRFPTGHWEELWAEAWSGCLDFAGGSLLFSTTPAMTLIDIDGDGGSRELALRAVEPIAEAIMRFGLGGSIGIDFPTIEAKADRRAVDEALKSALTDWPHESTAMNGFGFVQLIARLERPSLLHRIGQNRVGAATRLLLRRAEGVTEPGLILLTCHPAIKSRLKAEWMEELASRAGREIRVETDPGLALEAGFAQAVPS